MDSTSLQALLERLRSSSVVGHVLGPEPDVAPREAKGHQSISDESTPQSEPIATISNEGVSARISSLLARLRPQTSAEATDTIIPEDIMVQGEPSITIEPEQMEEKDVISSKGDYRSMTYLESLPRVQALLRDGAAIDVLLRLRQDQQDLEKRLWDERQSIIKRHDDKLKLAKDMAKMSTGSSVLEYRESKTLQEAREIELRRFDKGKALPAWDSILRKQQTVMENLGVPVMFETANPTERTRQQRLVRIIEDGLTEES